MFKRHFEILANLFFCPSCLMGLINPVLLKKNSIHHFFQCTLSFHHCRRQIIFKDPYFAFLTRWNVKKRYISFITRSILEMMQLPPSFSNLGVFFTDSDTLLFLVLQDTLSGTAADVRFTVSFSSRRKLRPLLNFLKPSEYSSTSWRFITKC